MGMAFADISVFQGNPVIQTLIAEGQLSDPVFAFNLASSGSDLRIGGVDTSLYTGSFTYAPITQEVRLVYVIPISSTDVLRLRDSGKST